MTKIEEMRTARGMSRKALAAAARIDESSIYRYERYGRQPDLLTAFRIANALGCRIEALVDVPEGSDQA